MKKEKNIETLQSMSQLRTLDKTLTINEQNK